MPEHEQMLADPGPIQARLDDWMRYQALVEEVFQERQAQAAQWGDQLPPIAIADNFRVLGRDELVQALAVGVKLVQDMDRVAAGG